MRACVLALLASLAAACGARTGLEVGFVEKVAANMDASLEASVDVADATETSHGLDAGNATEASAPCDFGTVVSNVFGAVVDFNGGASLPAGHYRITYVDGCMKYSSDQGWTVNAYADGTGSDMYWLVGGNHKDVIVPPGTVGFVVGDGAYADFDDCVAANLVLAPIDFDFGGGVLGVWLDDNPYSDNVVGENGRSPTWKLTCAN